MQEAELTCEFPTPKSALSDERQWYPMAMQTLRRDKKLVREASSVLGYTREMMELYSLSPLWQTLICDRLNNQRDKLSSNLRAWLAAQQPYNADFASEAAAAVAAAASSSLRRRGPTSPGEGEPLPRRARISAPAIHVEGSSGTTPSASPVSSATTSLDSTPSPNVLDES